MKTKITTKIICLIACLTMLIGSTVCVSAEENKVIYQKADNTSVWIAESEIPAVGSNGLPLFRQEYAKEIGNGVYAKVIQEVSGITPGGIYVYGDWSILYTPEQIALIYSLIDSAGITNEMPKYDKAVALNDAVCAALTYEITQFSLSGDGIYAVQMGGRGVCENFADLYQTLCQAVGIDCAVIVGVAGGIGHDWNVLSIDGKEYFVDPTWNDKSDNAYLMAEQNFADHERILCRSTDPYEVTKWYFVPAEYRTIRNYGPEDAPKFNINTAERGSVDDLLEALKNDTPITIREIPGTDDSCVQ